MTMDDLFDELGAELGRKKQRVRFYQRQGQKSLLGDRKIAALARMKARKRDLRIMRQSIFGAQDAVEASLEAGDSSPFNAYAGMFPHTAVVLENALAEVGQ